MFNHNATHSNQQITNIVLTVLVLIFVSTQISPFYHSASADSYKLADLNVANLYTMSQEGNGQLAVEQVANVAYDLGLWQPAPGDTVAYDYLMSAKFRGAMIDFDDVPAICRDKNQIPDPQACVESFRTQETQVRFGRSFFSTPQADGTITLRIADDIIGTYIEEVGHSWQEYAFETDGRMSGERAHPTSLTDAEYWAAGREYQIKMYILGLDGEVLELSAEERTNLVTSVCDSGNTYAYPIGREVPSYSAPANWPHPEYWPTSTPTRSEHLEFCASELQ